MNTKDCRGEIMQSIRITNVEELTPERLAQEIEFALQEKNIPGVVKIDTIQSGGRILGSWHPCVMISHPNPPQSYYDQMIIINGDILNFQFWGYSKATYKKNKKNELQGRGTLSGMLRGALVNDDDMAYQTEMQWQSDVADIIEKLIH